MSLAQGIRLGPYEIVAPLGAGGMGEVYRARDTRLGRDVAIKVLPAEFAADPERLRRFEQEARAAGAQPPQHPRPSTTSARTRALPTSSTELLEGEIAAGTAAPGRPAGPQGRRNRDPDLLTVWPRPTRRASSTATSSPPTSSSPGTATSRSSTSASPSSRQPEARRHHRAETRAAVTEPPKRERCSAPPATCRRSSCAG